MGTRGGGDGRGGEARGRAQWGGGVKDRKPPGGPCTSNSSK